MIEKPNSSPRTSESFEVICFIMIITLYLVYSSVSMEIVVSCEITRLGGSPSFL